jgi:hypothetical protein
MRNLKFIFGVILLTTCILTGCGSSDKCSKENAEKKLKENLSNKGYDVKSCDCYKDFSNNCEYGFHVVLLIDNKEKDQKKERSFDYIVKKTKSGEWIVK